MSILPSGKNICLLSDAIYVEGCHVVINVSGVDGRPLESPPNADNGKYAGRDGYDGADGQAGESAGNVYMRCRHLVNAENLEILANGGNGGHGQTGGDGQNGSEGNDGEDGKLPNGWFDGVKNYLNWYRIERGTEGRPGGRGGNGGKAGLGGKGGKQGGITVIPVSAGETVVKNAKNGDPGKDGRNGKGGSGGTGGRNGVDDGVAHQGSWCPLFDGRTWGKGKLDKKEYRRWYGFAGYELVFVKSEAEVRKSRATHGNRGQDGESASKQSHSRQSPASKHAIDEVQLTSQFMTAMSNSGVHDDQELDQMAKEIQAETKKANQTRQQINQNSKEMRKELQNLENETRIAQQEQNQAEANVEAQNELLEAEQANLEMSQAVLNNMLNQRKKVLEMVDQAESSMKQESLQVIEQQSRQATVLRQVDGDSLVPKAIPAPQVSDAGPIHKTEVVQDKFGFTTWQLQILENSVALMSKLEKLTTVGEGYKAAASKKVKSLLSFRSGKKTMTVTEMLDIFDTGKNLTTLDSLLQSVQIMGELAKIETPGVEILVDNLDTIITRHAEAILVKKFQEINVNIDSKGMIVAAHSIESAVKNIVPLREKSAKEGATPIHFVHVVAMLLETMTSKEFREVSSEEVAHHVILRLTGFIKKKSEETFRR
ncbi:uncharacterized protein LOC118433855 isoform X2 [Folsomia candida]|uniref:uncharacterized protein LOC118433855 isoform X2 n=1 Tax=Folsomia candida TaxID=158441 RepID=UPI0016054835|nr:uncharacterized protein LOC118433855 isoform X2 [Folsomia candida]